MAAALALPGCATAPSAGDPEAVAEFEQINDPAEPTNRAIFAVNQAIDTVVLEPAAGMYRHLVPPIVQTAIHNFLNNLRTPVILLNDLLQGDMDRAGTTLARFIVNSTVGVLGVGDPATDLGYERHDEDFGQTLATWGVEEGPYVMLPVFGPSNPRDAVGLAVDVLTDPLNWWAANTGREYVTYSRAAVRAVDQRARNLEALDELERSSLDYYAAIRSLYRQRRADEIRNGEPTGIMPAPGVSGTPGTPATGGSEELSTNQ